MEKLLARKVTSFPEKKNSFNILLKIHKTNIKLSEKLTRGQYFFLIKSTNLPKSKVKDFWMISVAYAYACSKHVWTLNFYL